MINLRDNTGLWGPPPSAMAALNGLTPGSLSEYPEPDSPALAAALARFIGVAPDCVITGCGADEMIDLAFRLAGPDATLWYEEPEFSMVPVFARANRLRRVCDGAVRYLSTPNNPTGRAAPDEWVRQLIQRRWGLTVLDGAYAEFDGGPDWFAEAVAAGRTLVIRTFSKAWGLAGLRIGYAVGSPRLIAELKAMRSPYSVSAPAAAVAVAALEQDAAWMRSRSRDVVGNRERLAAELAAIGAGPLPSRANFVLVPVPEANALARRLLAAGIAVRAFTRLPGVGDAIRIGIGPWPLMKRFLSAFEETFACA